MSTDENLARCIAERTMTICINVMSYSNQPMIDSNYGLISDNPEGGMILIKRQPMSPLFAVSSSCTIGDRITVTTKTKIASCTITYTFKRTNQVPPYSYTFYDKNVNYETTIVKETNLYCDAKEVPIAKPIAIRPPSNVFGNEHDPYD